MTADPRQGKAKEDQIAESRLTKLAAERKRLDTDRAAFEEAKKAQESTHAETVRKAGLWDKLEGAKSQGKALEVLRQLFSQDEIDTKVYNELSRDILLREPGEALSPAQVQEMVDARVEANLKQERETEAKKREDEKKAEETKKTQAADTNRRAFLEHVNTVFAKDIAKYPNIEAKGVKPGEVMEYVQEHFDKHDEVPSPEAILSHFEAKLKPAGAPETTAADLPGTVTSKWTNGAEPTDADWAKMTKQERWEHSKRQAGIKPGD